MKMIGGKIRVIPSFLLKTGHKMHNLASEQLQFNILIFPDIPVLHFILFTIKNPW